MTRKTECLFGNNVFSRDDAKARWVELINDRSLYTVEPSVEGLDPDEDDEGGEEQETWTAVDGTVFTDDWEEDLEDEYQELEWLLDDRHWDTAVLDDYFEDYARQYAEDVCGVGEQEHWPYNHIDWEAAAEALQLDWSMVEVGGYEYWVR